MLTKKYSRKERKYEKNLQISVSVKHLVFIWFCCCWCCCCDIPGWRRRFNSSDRASQLDLVNGVVVVVFKTRVGQWQKVRRVNLSLVEAPWWWARDRFAIVSGRVVEERRRRGSVETVKDGAVSRFVRRRCRVEIRAIVDPLMGRPRIRHDLGDAVRVAATRRSLQRHVVVGDAAWVSASWSASIFLFKSRRNARKKFSGFKFKSV